MFAKLRSLLLHNSSTRQTVVKNTFWLFTGELSGRLIRFFIVVYAARVLGPAQYGVFSYALTLAAFLTIFSDIGISALLTRETAKDPGLRQRYFSTSFVLKLILIAVCAVLALVVVPLISNVSGITELMVFVIAIFAFDSLREFGFGMNRALERMEREALVKIVLNGSIAVLGFIFLAAAPTAYAISFGYTIGTFIGLVLMAIFLFPYGKQIFSFCEVKLLLPIFKAAWPIGLLSVLGAVMINTDMVMLGWWSSETELGYYSTAQKIILLLYVIPALISSSLFPTFSRLAKTDNARFKTVLERGLTAAFALALPITLGGLAVAQSLITLFFGDEYSAAGTSFAILLSTVIIVFPSTLLSNALFAYNEQRQFLAFAATGAGANALFNLLLIPTYGIEGAAVATLLAQLIANVLIWVKMHKTNSFAVVPHLKVLLPASVAMAAVSFGLMSLGVPVLITIAISALVYVALLVVFKEPLLKELRQIF